MHWWRRHIHLFSIFSAHTIRLAWPGCRPTGRTEASRIDLPMWRLYVVSNSLRKICAPPPSPLSHTKIPLALYPAVLKFPPALSVTQFKNAPSALQTTPNWHHLCLVRGGAHLVQRRKTGNYCLSVFSHLSIIYAMVSFARHFYFLTEICSTCNSQSAPPPFFIGKHEWLKKIVHKPFKY